jgi:hypothetical protein
LSIDAGILSESAARAKKRMNTVVLKYNFAPFFLQFSFSLQELPPIIDFSVNREKKNKLKSQGFFSVNIVTCS